MRTRRILIVRMKEPDRMRVRNDLLWPSGSGELKVEDHVMKDYDQMPNAVSN